jgi:mRNA interferase HigB
VTCVHVISKKLLQEFWTTHADAKDALDAWHSVAKRAEWHNLEEVRQTYPSADAVDRWTVFNIRGNHYRLITTIHYNRQKIYIRHVLTHQEYSRGTWKQG